MTSGVLVKVKKIKKNNLFLNILLVRLSSVQFTQAHNCSTIARQTTEKQKQGEASVIADSTL